MCASFCSSPNCSTDSSPQNVLICNIALGQEASYTVLIKEEMLRDRIVVGMRDAALSERLQMDASLTLDKVKRELRQKEAVKEEHLQLQHERHLPRWTP